MRAEGLPQIDKRVYPCPKEVAHAEAYYTPLENIAHIPDNSELAVE
jgi:hypothetical protein